VAHAMPNYSCVVFSGTTHACLIKTAPEERQVRRCPSHQKLLALNIQRRKRIHTCGIGRTESIRAPRFYKHTSKQLRKRLCHVCAQRCKHCSSCAILAGVTQVAKPLCDQQLDERRIEGCTVRS
jgi:hypothetical protein